LSLRLSINGQRARALNRLLSALGPQMKRDVRKWEEPGELKYQRVNISM